MIMVVRLPYMPNPPKVSIYKEKTKENTIHPMDVKQAPKIWLLNLGRLFGSHTYKSTVNMVSTTQTRIYLKFIMMERSIYKCGM